MIGLIKKVKIKTTYKSEIYFDTVFHIDISIETIKITYLHENVVKQMYLKLRDISNIDIKIQE